MTLEQGLSTFLFIILTAMLCVAWGYNRGTMYHKDLYPKLAHGTDSHRLWLKLGIEAVLEGKDPPAYDPTPEVMEQK